VSRVLSVRSIKDLGIYAKAVRENGTARLQHKEDDTRDSEVLQLNARRGSFRVVLV
jgi:hypothetical protein